MNTKQYLIYADESFKKENFYSNFYGGALLEYKNLEKFSEHITNKKQELNLFSEIKWSKVTYQYLDKYIQLMDEFFKYITQNLTKKRKAPSFLHKYFTNNGKTSV